MSAIDVVFNTVDIVSHIINVGKLSGNHLRCINKAFRLAMPIDKLTTNNALYTQFGLRYSDTYIMSVINMACYSTYALFDWYRKYYNRLYFEYHGDFFRDIELVDKSTIIEYATAYREQLGNPHDPDLIKIPARFLITTDVYVINTLVKLGYTLPCGDLIGYLCLFIQDELVVQYCLETVNTKSLLLYHNLTIDSITSVLYQIMRDVPESITNKNISYILDNIGGKKFLDNCIKLDNAYLFSLYMSDRETDYVDDDNHAIDTELVESILTHNAINILEHWCKRYQLFNEKLYPRRITSTMMKIASGYGLRYTMLETQNTRVVIDSILTRSDCEMITSEFNCITFDMSVLQKDLSIHKLILPESNYAHSPYTGLFTKHFMTCGLDLIDEVFREDYMGMNTIVVDLLLRDDVEILRAVSKKHNISLAWLFDDTYVVKNNDIENIGYNMTYIRQNVLRLLLSKINTPINVVVSRLLYTIAINYGDIETMEKIHMLSPQLIKYAYDLFNNIEPNKQLYSKWYDITIDLLGFNLFNADHE